MPFGEVPADVDAETHLRIAHTFYVARMVRLAVLLGFALVFLVVVVVRDEPAWSGAVFGLLALASLSLLWRTRRRWHSARTGFEA